MKHGKKYVDAVKLIDKTKAYEILETYKGTDLERKEYEPLYECAAQAADKLHKKAFYVVCDEYVTMTDGTGIVHIAPAFGEDDANVGRKYDLPLVQMVDEKGCMKEETPFAGMRCKPTESEIGHGAISADPEVIKELSSRKLLFDAPKFEHDYPHCWRCDTPLLYFARESWFIKMTAVKDELIANNNTVNWIPESIGKGRFGDWLENIQDWGISRNRYWGTPLNIWECPDCGEQMSIGSRKELAEKSGNPDDEKLELHRPYIDGVRIPCPKCGGSMERENSRRNRSNSFRHADKPSAKIACNPAKFIPRHKPKVGKKQCKKNDNAGSAYWRKIKHCQGAKKPFKNKHGIRYFLCRRARKSIKRSVIFCAFKINNCKSTEYSRKCKRKTP